MRIQNLFLGISFLLMVAGNINAASFDCEKATSEVEKLICEDHTLSKVDEDLAALYAKTLKQAADPLLVKKQQSEWLRNSRDKCTNVSCLRDAYATRIKGLSSVLRTMSRRTAKPIKSDAEACQVVADFANRGILDNLSVPQEDSQITMEELEPIFGADTLDTRRDDLLYWRLDLNNDGIPDHLVGAAVGRARVCWAYVLSGKKGSTVEEVSVFDDESTVLSVLSVNGRYYVLSDCDSRMELWRLSKDGKFMPVCKFRPRIEPMVELVAGKENAVCSEVFPGRVHHVTYSLTHSLGRLPEGHYARDGLARVDIDNDGTPDNVVCISFTSRGCYGTYVAVTDETHTKIPETKLNEILSDKALCGSHVDVFVHDGTTYLDLQDDWGIRQIYRITGDKSETICEFRSHLLYDVVDVMQESDE